MSDPGRDTSIARYVAVSQVLSREAGGMTLSEALLDVAKTPIRDLDGRMIRVSARTLRRWVKAFKLHGLDGLWPKKRGADTVSKALPPDFIRFLIAEKQEDPNASLPEILRRAEIDGVITEPVSRVSTWRAARRLGLPIFADKGPANNDMRRFGFKHRMQMGLTDGKHFRAGSKRRKRVVMTFLDDATRFGLSAVVGTSEKTELFARGLHRAVQRWGRFSAIFVDNGSAFKTDAATICARLDIALIHGTADYPEGRGKIERFHGTLKQDLLRTFDGNPEIDPLESALELRIEHYLTTQYNRRVHESLEGQTPEERFLADQRALKVESDPDSLRRHFVLKKSRKVSRDNIVSVDDVPYEMPKGHAGRRVDVFRHMLDGTVSVISDGRHVTLSPVDKVLNASSPRARREAHEELPRPPKSAATRAFLRDHPPVVGPTGDFHEKQ
jgi:putative transposase